MKILILGGSGFIGSHALDKFLQHSAEVVVIDRQKERYRNHSNTFKFIEGDLSNITLISECIAQGFDIVLHCISTTGPKSSNESPEFDIQSNLISTVKLIELCSKYKIGKLIYLSSGGTVYGDIESKQLSNELDKVSPLCSYAICKISVEHYLQMYHVLYGLNFVSLRISNPYGPRQDPIHQVGVITVFIEKIIKNLSIEIWGDGTTVRDYIYIDDVVDAIYMAATNPINGIYNVGSGVPVSLNDLITEIENVLQIQIQPNFFKKRTFDINRVTLDISKLKNDVGWQPKINLQNGISKTYTWLASIK